MDKTTKEKFFHELMGNAYEKVYMFISRGCGDKGLVEDVVQETFYEAYRKIDMLMEHPNVMGWLYTTAKHKRMKLGAKKKEFCLLTEEHAPCNVKEIDESDYGVLELEETIKASVNEVEYEMLRDYYINGYTYTEVAEKYGLDKGVVRMRMSRLKKKLRDLIMASWLIFVAVFTATFLLFNMMTYAK